jgi:MinD-like ATPase involved in chromosome partitioning or flagellar assembly
MTRCIAFHSYKGGTGKTTLACNSAALLASKGYKVCLLDLDIYAPSFQTYFDSAPSTGINDFLNSKVEVGKAMIDFTTSIENPRVGENPSVDPFSSPVPPENREKKTKTGKLWIGFSSIEKQEIFALEKADAEIKREIVRRFIYLRERLISDYSADYIIIDTSPGLRFWSINSLAIADILLLTLKMGSLDIQGTRTAVNEIYKSFTKFGSKAYLLYNLKAGYCVPSTGAAKLNAIKDPPQNEVDSTEELSSELGVPVITAIPCYCDIQFSKREYFTVLSYPEHPFTKQIENLVQALVMP